MTPTLEATEIEPECAAAAVAIAWPSPEPLEVEPEPNRGAIALPLPRETAAAAAALPEAIRPRRLFYGWVMLPIAMAGLIATSPGQTFGVSVFNEPLRAALSLSHSQLAAAYMLGTLLAAIPIIYVGSLMDRFGLRAAMTVAVVLFGGACLAMSQVGGWPSLLLAFFALRLLGPGALAFMSANTLAFWFHRRLGTVEGIRLVGMAGAMAVIPALNLWLVQSMGWRGAYAALGIAVWALMLPLMIFLFRNHPGEVGQTIDGLPPEVNDPQGTPRLPLGPNFTLHAALRTRAFWVVVGGTSVFSLVQTAVFFSLVPIFLDRGLTEAHAVGMLSSFAASLAAMHLVGGMLADRFRAPLMLAAGLGLFALSLIALRCMSAPWLGHVGGVLMGIGQGLYFGASNPLWARYFGRMHLGKIRGVLLTVNVAASSFGPLLIGVARDSLGNHELALTAFALMPLPFMLLAFSATPPRPAAAPGASAAPP
ncbi:MAG: MFS transporter [Planctomycetaceae bacterium]